MRFPTCADSAFWCFRLCFVVVVTGLIAGVNVQVDNFERVFPGGEPDHMPLEVTK
jgi:hypothetical protein